jgi:hypothetical protein
MRNITNKKVIVNASSVFWLFFFTVLAMIAMAKCTEDVQALDNIVDLWIGAVALIFIIRFYKLTVLSREEKQYEQSIIKFSNNNRGTVSSN